MQTDMSPLLWRSGITGMGTQCTLVIPPPLWRSGIVTLANVRAALELIRDGHPDEAVVRVHEEAIDLILTIAGVEYTFRVLFQGIAILGGMHGSM